jgi:DNA-damage-inducible protein J
MPANSVIRARIDQDIKEEASLVLAAMGLTVSDALRLLMVRIAQDKILPFSTLAPNSETIAAIKAARAGDVKTAVSLDDLMSDLHADD